MWEFDAARAKCQFCHRRAGYLDKQLNLSELQFLICEMAATVSYGLGAVVSMK